MRSWEQFLNNDSKFSSIVSYLQRHDVGLLAQSGVDISRDEPLEVDCHKFYLLMANSQSGRAGRLLLKELPSRDEMIQFDDRSTKSHDEAIAKRMNSILDATPLRDFNPMSISSNFHSKLDEFMKRQPMAPARPNIMGQSFTRHSQPSNAGNITERKGYNGQTSSSAESQRTSTTVPNISRLASVDRKSRLMTHRILKPG